MAIFNYEVSEWEQVKPLFYEGAGDVSTRALAQLRQSELVVPKEELARMLDKPFYPLEVMLKGAVAESFNAISTDAPSCPYHEILNRKLGRRSIAEMVDVSEDQRTLLETSLPGGYEAPVLITNLISRMDAAARVHGTDVKTHVLAKNSSGLLHEPLRHPQQWAKAFVFTLVDPDSILTMGGEAFTFRRESGFLSDEILAEYT